MSDELENEIKRYNNSFRKLIKRKRSLSF
ncbi:hypothetical protein [Streptococcus pneumoniae]